MERKSLERLGTRARTSIEKGSPNHTAELVLKRKQDVFDAPDFDAVKFINQMYPDEASLSDLDRFVDVLKKQIRTVDKDIFQAVRAQGGAHNRARQEVEAAQSQIGELYGRVREIQRKAEESENMVQEICRDIRKLDFAKKHLTSAITALRRLAMLTAAVADLEACAGRRDQYKRSANLLEAVHQLMEYFQQYEDIPKVRGLAKRVAAVEASLQECVLDDFKLLMGTADVKVSADNLDRLAAGCAVIDALGPKVRDQLLDWVCDREMNIYQMFSSSGGSDGSGRLDRFERRFHWFRSRMEERKAEWSIFPDEWRVAQTLCLTFCKITKAHLKRILSDDEALGPTSGLRADISPLIKAVVATNKFEKDMAAAFGGGSGDLEDEGGEGGEGGAGANDEVSASEARKRLERFRQRMKVEEARRAADKGDRIRLEQESVRLVFEGAVSEAFDGALHLYVAEEEKELGAYLEGVLREEGEHGWRPSEEEVDARILPSANKIFLKIRASLTRCVKMISRGTPLLQLTQVFQHVLKAYAAALLARLPRTAAGTTYASPPLVGTDWYIRMNEEEEKVVCHLLHTAEFCRETLEGLTTALTKDIKPALAERVDLGEQEDAFQDVAGQCMNVLVLGLNTRLDAGIQELGRMRWDAIDAPGDDSPYVTAIRKVLQEAAPRMGSELDVTTFAFICDKAAAMFVPRFRDAVSRARRISDKGTLQLSIDCDSVRRALHEFPRAARGAARHGVVHADLVALGAVPPPSKADGGEEDGPFSSYHAYVERELGAVTNMVKVLQANPEHLVETYALLMPASAQNINDFARLCDMKGLSRAQVQALLAHFQQRVAGAEGMAGASPAGGATALAGPNVSSVALTNLGAFKLNMNNITALASNINFPGMNKGGQAGANSPGTKSLFTRSQAAHLGAGGGSGGPGHMRTASISAAAENMATKTKDTFAKMGNVLGSGFAKIGASLANQGSNVGEEGGGGTRP